MTLLYVVFTLVHGQLCYTYNTCVVFLGVLVVVVIYWQIIYNKDENKIKHKINNKLLSKFNNQIMVRPCTIKIKILASRIRVHKMNFKKLTKLCIEI